MSEVVLTVLQRPDLANHLLRAAERMSALADGARVSVMVAQAPMVFARMMSDGAIPEKKLAAMEAAERERIAALRGVFDAWLAEPRDRTLPAQWCSVEDLPSKCVAERGSRADIIVVPRPGPGDDWMAKQIFETAVFKTERPVLVVPPGPLVKPEFGRRVAVAWRDDGRAVKAVVPALRYLSQAERVLLLAGVREGKARPAAPEVLAEHGIEAELHVLPVGHGVFGEALLAKAHELGADLLVMGAYAHSPLREWVFGGLTRFMLAHADLPVLMRH